MGKTVKLPISDFLLDEPHAHADKLWGPYPSVEAAAAAIPAAMKVASFKFGVLSGGVFSEYIYLENNGTPQELASLKVQLLLNPASGAVAGKILSLDNDLKPVWVDPSSTAERVSFDNSEEIFDGDVTTTQAAIEALKDLLDALDGDVVKGILVNGSEVSIEHGVASITIPDAITSVIANNELVFQTPDGQSVKGKVGITTGADGLLHLTLTDEEGHTYSSPIAGLRVVGNALQYSNDGETWVTVQTFGKLAIKYVQASDPASGDEGDLALVGSTNAYVLKVYVGGSWVSVGDIGTLDLTSDGITMVGENKTLTESFRSLKQSVDGYATYVTNSSFTVGNLNSGHNSWNNVTNIISYEGTCAGVYCKAFKDGVVNVILMDSNNNTITYIKRDVAVTSGLNTIIFDEPITVASGQYVGFNGSGGSPIARNTTHPTLNQYYNNSFQTYHGYGDYCLISDYQPSLPDRITETQESISSMETAIDDLDSRCPTLSSDFGFHEDVVMTQKAITEHLYLENDRVQIGEISNVSGKNANIYGLLCTTSYEKDFVISKLKIGFSYTGHAKIVICNRTGVANGKVLREYDITINNNEIDLYNNGIVLPAYCAIGLVLDTGNTMTYGANEGNTSYYYTAFNTSATQSLVDVSVNASYFFRGGSFYFEAIDGCFLKSIIFPAVKMDNSTKVIFCGSSLTDCYFTPRGFSWIERLNDMVDVNISNNGETGGNLARNIKHILVNNLLHQYNGVGGLTVAHSQSVKGYAPTYIWWGNSANGTQTGVDGHKMLGIAKEITESLGAKMIIGSEEDYAYDLVNDYERTFHSFAENHDLLCSTVLYLSKTLYGNPAGTKPYQGFIGNRHSGYRTSSCYVAHKDLLDSLVILFNVKLFKIRPMYKNGTPTVGDLIYDTNEQRLRYFYAIGCGANDTFSFEKMDNLDNNSYAPTPNTGLLYGQNEVAQLSLGEPVSFSKFALMEFIIPTTDIDRGILVFNCSVEPSNVYVAIVKNVEYKDEHASASTWSDIRTAWEDVEFDYSDGKVSVTLRRANKDISLYDKVRFLVYYDGDFTISSPVFSDFYGDAKVLNKTPYHSRLFGEELNDKTSVEDGWTLADGASVESFPSEIAVYTPRNNVASHLELADNNATAEKTIQINQPCSKVAVRVACQSFKKIVTIRSFSNMTVEEKAKYISETNDITNFEYDYGTIRVVVNDCFVHEAIVMQGWTEVYFEVPVLPSDTSIKIKLQRNNWVDASMPNSDNPLLVHDVSVQKIS